MKPNKPSPHPHARLLKWSSRFGVWIVCFVAILVFGLWALMMAWARSEQPYRQYPETLIQHHPANDGAFNADIFTVETDGTVAYMAIDRLSSDVYAWGQ